VGSFASVDQHNTSISKVTNSPGLRYILVSHFQTPVLLMVRRLWCCCTLAAALLPECRSGVGFDWTLVRHQKFVVQPLDLNGHAQELVNPQRNGNMTVAPPAHGVAPNASRPAEVTTFPGQGGDSRFKFFNCHRYLLDDLVYCFILPQITQNAHFS
jgi:hypothetical protein